MRPFKLTYYLLESLLIISICLSGCAKDEVLLSSAEEQQELIQAQLLLYVTIPTAATRAIDGDLALPGTESESCLRKITLFMVDQNGGVTDYTVEGENLEKEALIISLGTTEGEKEIYVGANMSEEQIAAVKTNRNQVMTLNSINDITKDNHFLMTAQAKDVNGATKINIVANRTTKITASLDRIMSKVLLTCQTDNNGYVKLSDKSRGYIKLANVHYILETTNKKYYIFEQPNNEDPNYSMSETLGQAYGDNFFNYSGKVEESTFTAIKTDDSRVSSTDNPYTEGIYCLENTVKLDFDYGENPDKPKEVATYIKVAAKFTPMCIDSETELSEQEAIDKLSSNNGTFWACKKAPEGKKHICYSSIDKGKKFLGGNLTDANFTEYKGGWQYYEAFVASPTTFSEASNLKRNNYYIVNVTSMTAPIQDKSIEVNTTVAAWRMKGKTTIDIETGK